MNPAELAPLPDSGWPRGWWLASQRLGCCAKGQAGHGHLIAIGVPIFLTGEPGEVYCGKHAPARAAGELGEP